MRTNQHTIARTNFGKRRVPISKLAVWAGVLLACTASHAADVSFIRLTSPQREQGHN